MKPAKSPGYTLEELNVVVETVRRQIQSDKDRAVKDVQRQVDELRNEIAELRELLRQALSEGL